MHQHLKTPLAFKPRLQKLSFVAPLARLGHDLITLLLHVHVQTAQILGLLFGKVF